MDIARFVTAGRVVAHFSKHPVTVPMTKKESGGFSHL